MSTGNTYTEEELAAAIAAAVSPLEATVAQLREAQQSSEVAEQISAATAPLEAQIAELQTQLDEATLRAETEKERADGIVAWLESEATAKTEADAAEARKAERVAKIAEVAKFPDKYVEDNADRWAAMEEDAFSAFLEGCGEIASANGSKLPAFTGLQASREDKKTNGSAVREVMRLRRSGVDPRTITR